jgi:hypothetical protein
MNKSTMIPLFLILVAGGAQARGGGGADVGNGGNVIQCSGSSELQSFDYVLTQNILNRNLQLRPAQSLQESLQRIRSLIATQLPELSGSFDEFIQQIRNTDPSKHYVWVAETSLNEIDTPEHVFIPAKCRNLHGSIRILQAVVRNTTSDPEDSKIFFHYDPQIYTGLAGLQLSFLVVHEWLWNFTDDITVNRKVDYLLHSSWLENVSSNEAMKELEKLGIRFP